MGFGDELTNITLIMAADGQSCALSYLTPRRGLLNNRKLLARSKLSFYANPRQVSAIVDKLTPRQCHFFPKALYI